MGSSTIFRNRIERERMRRWRERFLERAPAPVEERTLDTAFGETSALVAGPPDAPPLVVLHGALASAAHVVPELDRLLTTRRVHVLDVVGQSPASADRRLPMDDDSYGRWFAQACAALGLGDVDVYGVSWGGFVALRAAMLPGSRVRRLVLLVPAGLVSGPAWEGLTKVGLPLLLYRTFPSHHRLRRAVASQFSTPTPEWTAYFGDALRSYRLDVRVPPLMRAEDAARITCPVLAFGADRDLSFPGRALVARVRELLPQAETELLDDSRHCPPQTADFRARMADRIERFLDGPAPGADIVTPPWTPAPVGGCRIGPPMAHSHESSWFKRTGFINLVLVLGILAVMMALGPFELPNWFVVVLLVAVILMSVGLTAKRMRVESRLARTVWSALTRRSR